MKKILVNLIVFALILGFATSTYAFSVSVDSSANEVKTNNQVTLEVNFEENLVTTDFVVKYDTSKFRFVKTNTEGADINNIEASGEIVVCFYDMNKIGTNSIELVFEAKDKEGIGRFELADITGNTNKVQLEKEGSAIIKNISINKDKEPIETSNTITSTPGGRDDIDTTVSNSRLPNTGAKISIGLGVALLIVGIIAIKYRKDISNKSRGIFSVLLVAGILVSSNNTLALNLFNIKVDENNKLVTVESFVGSVLEKDNLEEVLKEQISSNEIATGLNVKENYSLIIYGDVNKDGKINSSDIYNIINSNVRALDKNQTIAANVHNANELDINENDIKVIEKYILRLEDLVVKNSDTSNEENEEVTNPDTEENKPETPENIPDVPNTEDNDEIQGEENKPGTEDGTTPDTEDNKPGTEDGTTPDAEDNKPGTEEGTTPGAEDNKPGTEEGTTPGAEDNKPGTEDETTPDTEDNKPEETPEIPREPICRRIVKDIKYSNTNVTWEDVTVVVTAKEELGETPGWTLSEDKMSVSKTYKMNTVEKVKIYAANGDYEEIKVTVLNIWDLGQEDDIEDLTASIFTRNKDGKFGNTYGSVIVTITTNNPVRCPDGWTKASSDGTKIQKEYTENTTEVLKLTDEYGSKLILEINVTNILVAVEDFTLSLPYNTDDNGVYLVNTTDATFKQELGFLVNSVITPNNATKKELEWKITDEDGNEIDYATIENGRVSFKTKTVTTQYGDYTLTETVLDDSVVVGSKFIITARTLDISNIEKSITCSLESAPTKISLGLNNIYLFLNGNATKLLGTEEFYKLDDMGNITETITNEIYQTPSMQLNAELYPAGTTINNEIQYRIVRETETDVFVEDTTGFAEITNNTITGLMNTGNNDKIYLEAYTGKNAEVITRARLYVYTTPENITILNSANEEITTLAMSTNKDKTERVKANLLPETVSTDFESSAVTWSTDNTNVIELPTDVNKKEIDIKAAGTGTANLTVTASNGKSKTIRVTVGVDVQSIEIDPETVTLENGTQKESKALSVIFNPEDYTGNREIIWSTSNSSQVTVNEDGVITAVANTGNTPVTITATLASNPSITATSKVSVANVPTSLTLTKSVDTIYVNSNGYNQATITATIDESATVSCTQPIYWKSSDTSIATVAAKQTTIGTGNTETSIKVTAVRSGTVTISAWTAGTEASRQLKTITLNVETDPSAIISKTKSCTLIKGNTLTLTTAFTPLDANHNTALTFVADNTDVATVSNTGVITAVAEGRTNVTIKTANDKTTTISVTVLDKKEADTFTYKEDSIVIPAGSAVTPALIKGADMTETVTYSSSNTEVITVAENGSITPVKSGSATITATCGEKTARLNVTVYDYATTARASGSTNITLKHNNTAENTTTLSVNVANNASVKWYSSDTEVATVDTNGKVTTKGGGTCKIYAVTPAETPAVVTWNITVQVAPTNIRLTSEDGTNQVIAGQTKEIRVTYPLGTTTDKQITWTPLADGIVDGAITASTEKTDVYIVKILNTITANTNVVIKAETPNGKSTTLTLNIVPATASSSEPFNASVATDDFVTKMLRQTRMASQKAINYVEIENSKLFDITEENNYYAIVNENSETKLVKIVDGQRLENSITISNSNIIDIEAINDNTVNILVKENDNKLEILKIDFENVQVLERYNVYTENKKNVENTLVKLNEKENQLTVLSTDETKTEIKIYTLSDVKNKELNTVEAKTLSVSKGTEENSFNKYEIKAFTVVNNKIHIIEEKNEAYLTVFTTEGIVEMQNKALDKTNIESIVVTTSDIFVGI